MTDLWAIGVPILIADIANPVLLAGVIMGLSAKKPITTSFTVIVGHMVSYLMFGLLVIFGLAELIERIASPLLNELDNPVPSNFIAEFIIGLLLLIVAWRWKINPPDPKIKKPEKVESGILPAFLFGAVVSAVGIPFALPYFAFINQIHGLNDTEKVVAIAVYNALYALPFLLVPIAFAAFGTSLLPVLEQVNRFVERMSAYIFPIILGLLGITLVLDATLFFATGEALL